MLYGFEVGDLVQLRWPRSKDEAILKTGVVAVISFLDASSPLNPNISKYKILWSTTTGKSVIIWHEGGELELIAAVEGNEKRYAKYRRKEGNKE
jgi:hypothetical protein